MHPSSPLVSVVVPSRDEAGNIGPLAERVASALSGIPFELCFVDDSDDSTQDVIRGLELPGGAVRLLARQGDDRRGGLSTAVVDGLHMARGRWVCVMDADLQHPPELIPRLLAAGEAGADLVVASRYVRGGSRAGLDGLSRRMVSRAATAVARLLFKEARASTDPLSGFFLCRRSLLDGIEFRPVGFKILLELLVCVPDLRTVDIALSQERRTAGTSKAGVGQGLLYLRHLWSLFTNVPGSARRWKFGLVGLSGLVVFLPLLWAAVRLGMNPLAAFVPAFALSVAWNTGMNWLWTFADQHRTGGASVRRYIEWALVAGIVMFGVYALLLDNAGLPILAAGVISVLVAMVVNAVVNRSTVTARPSVWAAVALDQGVQASLQRLAVDLGADRSYLLPGTPRSAGSIPEGLLAHAIKRRHPVLFTESPSHRAQRRTDIEMSSYLLIPVVAGGEVAAVVVCERDARRGFDTAALETATRAVGELVPILSSSRSDTPQSADHPLHAPSARRSNIA